MSKPDSEARLPGSFDAMLKDWRIPERDAASWDTGAEKVMDRLENASAEGGTDVALLSAPLPAERGEPGFSDEARGDEPPPRSLAELARMSLAAGPADDGAADLAKESFSLSTSARASAPAIAEQARTSASAMDLSAADRHSAAPAGPAAPIHALATRGPPRSAAGPLVMAGIGLLGLAAAATIVFRAQRHDAPVSVAAAPPSAAPVAMAAPAATSTRADGVVSIDDLALKAAGESPAAAPGGEKAALKGGAVETKPAEPSAAAGAKPEPAPEPVAKAEDKKDDEAAKLMKPAATAGDLPDKPSTGAVQAAIGSVMGSARACVAGHDEASRATINFGSDGRVQSVAVSGKAAGTPAESCIRAALSKARVQPFARPSFGVGATVRP